jgi:hypothetical protein
MNQAGITRRERKAVIQRLCRSLGSIVTSIGYLPEAPVKPGNGFAIRKRYAYTCAW